MFIPGVQNCASVHQEGAAMDSDGPMAIQLVVEI